MAKTKKEDNKSFYMVNSAPEWKKQLITKEDPAHVHKALGLLALISFAYRFALAGRGEADLGFASRPHWTVPTLLLHLALNVSAFRFRIPRRRIVTSGYRIWPEYRLHSLVFCCRNLAFMALFWCESELGLEQNRSLNLAIVLATMAAAEWSSQCQGKYRSGFARELDVSAGTKYFFSLAQFTATAICLVGQRRYTMHFLMVLIIQGNAFLMTMRRKSTPAI